MSTPSFADAKWLQTYYSMRTVDRSNVLSWTSIFNQSFDKHEQYSVVAFTVEPRPERFYLNIKRL